MRRAAKSGNLIFLARPSARGSAQGHTSDVILTYSHNIASSLLYEGGAEKAATPLRTREVKTAGAARLLINAKGVTRRFILRPGRGCGVAHALLRAAWMAVMALETSLVEDMLYAAGLRASSATSAKPRPASARRAASSARAVAPCAWRLFSSAVAFSASTIRRSDLTVGEGETYVCFCRSFPRDLA